MKKMLFSPISNILMEKGKKRLPNQNKIIALYVGITTSFLLCSCTVNHRASFAVEHGISVENLTRVEGKWRNTPQKNNFMFRRLLWEHLTTIKETDPNAVVGLEITGKRSMTATLWVNNIKTNSRIIKINQKSQWYELPTQHLGFPLLWYFIWGWQTREIALGININGNLCVHNVASGILMITILPTIGDSDGCGVIDEYERVEATNDRE